MRRITTAASLALIAVCAWAPAAHACRGTGRTPNSQTVDAVREAVTCLINQRRHHHHLRAVDVDVALGSAAQRHSDAMAAQDFFDHNGSDGTPRSRAGEAGYGQGARSWMIGEDLAFGTGRLSTPKSIVAAWMASGIHREVLLSKRWRQVGVGVAIGSPVGPDGSGMGTYTVDFGFRRG